MKPNEQTELVPQDSRMALPPTAIPSPITILEAAVKGGITAENVAVMKELVAMCREQRADEAKAAFAKAFFQLKKNMPQFYLDKEAKGRDGSVVYTYCSEEEITKQLEPHLTAHGFAMMFGQSEKDGRINVQITLMHEQGHQETREFSVRPGQPNAMKDAAACDTGAATTAWRHLVMKWFSLKSRIHSQSDATVLGSRITPEKAIYLRELVHEAKADEAAFLKFAQVTRYEDIAENDYARLVAAVQKKMKGA